MEKKVLGRREAMVRFEESPIYVITDEGQSAGRGNLTVVRAALEAGAKFVQYREKKKALRAMYEEGLLLRKLTAEYDAALIVDDFVDLAMLIGADGVHVGQDDLPAAAVRELVGDDMVIGLSTHNQEDLAGAVAAVGAEHCAVVSDITMAEDIGRKIAALTASMKKFALI